jgi:hypothetical protein
MCAKYNHHRAAITQNTRGRANRSTSSRGSSLATSAILRKLSPNTMIVNSPNRWPMAWRNWGIGLLLGVDRGQRQCHAEQPQHHVDDPGVRGPPRRCPLLLLRFMPRCSTAPRPVSSPIPRSTARRRRPSSPPCAGSPRPERRHHPVLLGVPSSPPAGVKDMVTGAVALAEFANVVAEKYPVNVALHTDHCPMHKLDGYMRPLLDISHRAREGRQAAAVPVAHVGRLGHAARGEPRHRRGDCSTSATRPTSSWSSRSASSVARRTASRPSITPSCSPPRRTVWPPPRNWASGSVAATWSPRPSATCTACTSRATWCSRRASSRTSRTPSARSTA